MQRILILPFIVFTFLRLQYVSSTFNPSLIVAYSISEYNKYAKYQNSLHNLLGTLTELTSNHGFYNFTTTFPNTPNQLHGLYLCHGDVDPQACHTCVNSAKNDILNNYGHGREGLAWYDHCMVRYSNESFLGKFDEGERSQWFTSSWDNSKIKGSRIHFMKILKDTMKSLAIQASSGQNEKKFASKVVNKFSMFHSLYAMVQCTPDLVASDCYRCLTNTNLKLLGMRGSTSGKVLYRSCIAQYKTFSFTSSNIKFLPSPSSTEATNKTLIRLRARLTTLPSTDSLNQNRAKTDRTLIRLEARLTTLPSTDSLDQSRGKTDRTLIRLEGSDPDDADGSDITHTYQ